MTPAVQIVRHAEADTLWVVRDRIRFMGEVASTDLSVLEVEVPPGSGTPPHIHASPEIFRVLAGEITFGIFDGGPPSEVVAGEGAVVTVSPRAPHNYHRGREDRLSTRSPLPPNRTCGSPASGSPVGSFTSERIDGSEHRLW